MITRPLFDRPPAKPARRAKSATPTLPPVAKSPRECWRITVVPTGDGPPAIIRVRRMLKSAIRGHKLRAVCVECLGTVATPSVAMASISSESPAGPETAANEAAKTPMRIDMLKGARNEQRTAPR